MDILNCKKCKKEYKEIHGEEISDSYCAWLCDKLNRGVKLAMDLLEKHDRGDV